MKKNIFGKSICVVIIIIFIGVSYSSAISSQEKSSFFKKQSEENFNGKQISDVYFNKLERKFNRLEANIKLINLLSKNNLNFELELEELSDSISALKNINNGRPICDVLENIYLLLKDRIYYLRDIYINFQEEEPLKAFILNILAIPIAEAWLMVWVIGYELNCWEDPF